MEDEVRNLNNVLNDFTISKNKLTNIIGSQKNFTNIFGLGFRKHNQKKFKKKYFENINCFYCNRKGYHIKNYTFRKGTYVLK